MLLTTNWILCLDGALLCTNFFVFHRWSTARLLLMAHWRSDSLANLICLHIELAWMADNEATHEKWMSEFHCLHSAAPHNTFVLKIFPIAQSNVCVWVWEIWLEVTGIIEKVIIPLPTLNATQAREKSRKTGNCKTTVRTGGEEKWQRDRKMLKMLWNFQYRSLLALSRQFSHISEIQQLKQSTRELSSEWKALNSTLKEWRYSLR